jgi:hypothetical protein
LRALLSGQQHVRIVFACSLRQLQLAAQLGQLSGPHCASVRFIRRARCLICWRARSTRNCSGGLALAQGSLVCSARLGALTQRCLQLGYTQKKLALALLPDLWGRVGGVRGGVLASVVNRRDKGAHAHKHLLRV